MLLALLQLGLSYNEAMGIGMEEAQCLLHHAQLEARLTELDREAVRIAGMQFADPHEQQRALAALQHGAEAMLDSFHRSTPGATRSSAKE